MKKNLLILFFVLAIIFTIDTVNAQGGLTGPLTWNISENTLTISGNGDMPNYSWGKAPWFPYRESINNVEIEYGVTTIGARAFTYCTALTSITISSSVTTIGDFAFSSCIVLASITIPSNITTIKYGAFMDCKHLTSVILLDGVTTIGNSVFQGCDELTSIIIPNSITTIGDQAFYECSNLTSINIPNSITTIGYSAFSGCNALTSITIPNSVIFIGSMAFIVCASLVSINVDSDNINYSSDNGVLFNKDKTTLICYPAGKPENNYVIPNSVSTIGHSAFSSCMALSSIPIPNNVKTIEGYAFSFCKTLTSITIPSSITSINAGTFYGCESLSSLNTIDSVTYIGVQAFFNCIALTSITLPSNLKSIDYEAFSACFNLTSITNLNPVPIEITDYVFSGVDKHACTLYVPNNSVHAYKQAEVWKEFNIIGIVAGLKPLELFDYIIYPNPTTGLLYISNSELKIQNIKVFNIMGGTISVKTDIKTIDISHLSAGIYFIQIETESGSKTQKIIKE